MPSSRRRRLPAPPDLRELFERESLPVEQMRLAAHERVYATGDRDDGVYFVESGQVKIVLSSSGGHHVLMAIHATGDVFGESCFIGSGRRNDTATAMVPTVLRRASRADFSEELSRTNLIEPVITHLAIRIENLQTTIFDLITLKAKGRLAHVLLRLADKLGELEGEYLTLNQRISHEELAEIVGTTRPRVTAFMQQFKQIGILDKESRTIRLHRGRVMQFIKQEEDLLDDDDEDEEFYSGRR